jgi:hypothetical protein
MVWRPRNIEGELVGHNAKGVEMALKRISPLKT